MRLKATERLSETRKQKNWKGKQTPLQESEGQVMS